MAATAPAFAQGADTIVIARDMDIDSLDPARSFCDTCQIYLSSVYQRLVDLDKEVTWRRRPYVLDHIFHNSKLRCVGHRVIPTPASDHHVLTGDFEFAG